MTASPQRKRPWELHALVCLHALLLGYAATVSEGTYSHYDVPIVAASLTVSFAALFRGSLVAWYGMTFAFAITAVGTCWMSTEALREYGLRAHPLLLKGHLLTLSCWATLGLLIVNRIRGAFPQRGQPLFQDLPAFSRAVAILAPIILVVACIASLMIVSIFATARYHLDGNARVSLKTIASAEAYFRANDCDGNRMQDYWTGDVAGLYGIVPKEGERVQIKLIEISVAGADGNPLSGIYPPVPTVTCPKAGAWFQALDQDRSVVPPERYRDADTPFHAGRFGFVAYPDDYVAGLKHAFIINESNTILYRRVKDDLRPSDRLPPGPLKLPAHWPSDDELKANWTKRD